MWTNPQRWLVVSCGVLFVGGCWGQNSSISCSTLAGFTNCSVTGEPQAGAYATLQSFGGLANGAGAYSQPPENNTSTNVQPVQPTYSLPAPSIQVSLWNSYWVRILTAASRNDNLTALNWTRAALRTFPGNSYLLAVNSELYRRIWRTPRRWHY